MGAGAGAQVRPAAAGGAISRTITHMFSRITATAAMTAVPASRANALGAGAGGAGAGARAGVPGKALPARGAEGEDGWLSTKALKAPGPRRR